MYIKRRGNPILGGNFAFDVINQPEGHHLLRLVWRFQTARLCSRSTSESCGRGARTPLGSLALHSPSLSFQSTSPRPALSDDNNIIMSVLWPASTDIVVLARSTARLSISSSISRCRYSDLVVQQVDFNCSRRSVTGRVF